MRRINVLELFSGFGGTAQGARRAGVDTDVAVDYSKIACDVYSANFSHTNVIHGDLMDWGADNYVDPLRLPPAAVLLASPSCTHHSLANLKRMYTRGRQLSLLGETEEEDVGEAAQRQVSEYSRQSMVVPLQYAVKHKPELVLIENVVEVVRWGPDRDGSTFLWWWNEWQKLGYRCRILSLNSQFFPFVPQSRDRVFIVCWKQGNREPALDFTPGAACMSDICSGSVVEAQQAWKSDLAHGRLDYKVGKYGQQYVYMCPRCHRRVYPQTWPASSAIDWTDAGIPIGERVEHGLRPLSPATMERIRRALAKFSIDTGNQSINTLVANESDSTTTGRAPALFIKNNGGTFVSHTVSDPFCTITAHDTTGLIIRTRTSTAIDEDIQAVSYRMLKANPELRKASDFDYDYVFACGAKQMEVGLGNAVIPAVASWVISRMLESLVL